MVNIFAWNLADLFQALMGIFNIGIIIFLAKHTRVKTGEVIRCLWE